MRLSSSLNGSPRMAAMRNIQAIRPSAASCSSDAQHGADRFCHPMLGHDVDRRGGSVAPKTVASLRDPPRRSLHSRVEQPNARFKEQREAPQETAAPDRRGVDRELWSSRFTADEIEISEAVNVPGPNMIQNPKTAPDVCEAIAAGITESLIAGAFPVRSRRLRCAANKGAKHHE